MIESEANVASMESTGTDDGAAQAVPASAGQLLREARERQHVTVEGLAAALKVPVYKLQALEDNRWEALTDSIFTRALALSVCRSLHIPAEPVMALLPKAQAAKLAQNPEGLNEPFRAKSLRSSMAGGDAAGGHWWKLAALLVIAAAGLGAMYWVPNWQSSGSDVAEVAAAETVAEPLVLGNVAEEAQAPTLVDAPPVPAADAPSAAATAETTAKPASTAAAPTPSATAPAAAMPAATAATNAPVAAQGKPVLRVTAQGETWVQVRGAQQQVVAEKILKAGEVFDVLATRPLAVVVGNADATLVEIDGAPFALAPVAKSNVARFEVK